MPRSDLLQASSSGRPFADSANQHMCMHLDDRPPLALTFIPCRRPPVPSSAQNQTSQSVRRPLHVAALVLAVAAMLLSVRLTAEQWDIGGLPLFGPKRPAPRVWLPQPVPVAVPLTLPEQVRSTSPLSLVRVPGRCHVATWSAECTVTLGTTRDARKTLQIQRQHTRRRRGAVQSLLKSSRPPVSSRCGSNSSAGSLTRNAPSIAAA